MKHPSNRPMRTSRRSNRFTIATETRSFCRLVFNLGPRLATQFPTHIKEAYMLGKANAIPTIAVKNLDTARRFYRDTLGLKEGRSQDSEVLVFTSGDSLINVYRSEFAG